MIANKHKGDFMCRELAALNNEVGGAEHAQWILLNSVKASLYANKHKGEFMCREHASAISGESCDIIIIIISYSYIPVGLSREFSDPVSIAIAPNTER